jgi:large subunit ribosomal protein L13
VDTLSYKTVSANSATVNKEWLLVDAEGQELGRLASIVASRIRGKHKTNFTPHVDCGDNVVVINADKVVLTGNKLEDKEYLRYSGYPGGQRAVKAGDQMRKDSTVVIEKAVRGMLPKNRLGRQLFNNLYVYAGAEHEQSAQKPAKLDINELK